MRPEHRPIPLPAAVAALPVSDEPFLADPMTRVYAAGSGSLAQRLDEQVVIDLEGRGLPSERAFVARTRAAAELLATPRGAALERMLRGMLGVFDAAGAPIELRGFALSTSLAGDAVSRAVTLAEEGILPALASPDMPEVLGSFLPQFIGSPGAPSGVIDTSAQAFSRIHFNPVCTDMLLQMAEQPTAPTVRVWNTKMDGRAARSEIADVVGHELQHRVTPLDLRLQTPGYWIEEATAGALSTWPGAPEAMAAALRFDDLTFQHPMEPTGFHGPIKAMRRLVELAGLDPLDPSHRAGATKLLQSREFSEVPAALADAIAREHGLSAGARGDIEARIRDLVDWRDDRGEELLDPPEIAPRLKAIEQIVARGQVGAFSPVAVSAHQ